MRLLVYGAGVLGSLLAHLLLRGNNDVTLLARGMRKRGIDEQGLVIRHYIQRKITIEKIKTIETLPPEDIYDIIFVVMQYIHLSAILPMLAENQSNIVVLIGNNPTAAETYTVLSGGTPKNILFGFLAAAGRRENGTVVSLHFGAKITLGSISGDTTAYKAIRKAFKGVPCKLDFIEKIDGWLKSHLAIILPIGYACYATGGNLKKADGTLLHQLLDAMSEGYAVLNALGIPVALESEDGWFRSGSRRGYLLLKLLCKTPLGKLIASDHAMSAIPEMQALNTAFDALKKQTDITTLEWDKLERFMPVSFYLGK
ncbi:ketopantoate reductase family protein [Treponema primitia]|uniref:ketopantoate reductase family protein n=1 Tax=Treponema primitia TaxID=88058 RepID=UPI0002554FB2|nr:2-dehydropantoate 2-reductase N-terminal domain-containing protein [Treponema primitia]